MATVIKGSSDNFKVGDIIVPISLKTWTSEYSDNSPITSNMVNKTFKVLKICTS
jgi:hypothetical protein